jgi:hypothetical protein
MTTTSHKRPAPAPERLGILLQGMGAVASTVVAGVLAIRQGLGEPVGSLTQMATSASASAPRTATPEDPRLRALAPIDGIVFGGWDIFGGDLYDACTQAEVLEPTLLAKLESALREIKSRCPARSTRTTSSGSTARTSSPARAVTGPTRCARTSATSRPRTTSTAWSS